MKSVFIIIFIDLIQRYTYWTQDVNWTYIRRSEDVVNAFWTSYIRSIYVLCLGRCFSFWTWACLFCLPYRYQFFIVILENSCVGIQKQAMEVFCEKNCSKNFCNFHRKTVLHCSLSLLKTWRPATLLKRNSNTGYCEICEIFRNICFEEHLRTITFRNV